MLPSLIQVGTYTYRVHRDPSRLSSATRGQCDCNHHVIELQDNMPPVRERVTALHEVGHAVLDFAGWRDQGSDEVKYTVEQFMDALIPGLLGVLRDNPDLVAYLCERE